MWHSQSAYSGGMEAAATTYLALIARNVRAARAAADLSQVDVAERMQSLGFREWRRQTVGSTERGKRRLNCEEALGLMVALDTTLETLLYPPKEREWQEILLPGGQATMLPTAKYGHTPSGVWDGNVSLLKPYPHGRGERS
jgi:transcriptional regulator with XRE-family HTH domain